jgi:RHS repeat-associated protein
MRSPYDYEERQISRIDANFVVHYVYQGTEVIFEKNVTTGDIRNYVYANGIHLSRVDGAIGSDDEVKYWYVTDSLGSIRAVTNEEGEKVWDMDYLAFGTRLAVGGKEGFEEWHSFTGKEYDNVTGLYYYNARWYDSDLGKFISEDPAADPNNPNLYTYCANNPLRFTDPDGRVFSVSGDYVDEFFEALDYLKNNSETAKAVIEALENSPEVLKVYTTKGTGTTKYNPIGGISWDAGSGLAIEDNIENVLSPVMCLFHELAHEYDGQTNGFNIYDFDSPLTFADRLNKWENEIVDKYESIVSNELIQSGASEGFRVDYSGGTMVPTESMTSNKVKLEYLKFIWGVMKK